MPLENSQEEKKNLYLLSLSLPLIHSSNATHPTTTASKAPIHHPNPMTHTLSHHHHHHHKACSSTIENTTHRPKNTITTIHPPHSHSPSPKSPTLNHHQACPHLHSTPTLSDSPKEEGKEGSLRDEK